MLIFAGLTDAVSTGVGLLGLLPVIGIVAPFLNGIIAFLAFLTLSLWFGSKGLGFYGAFWGGAGLIPEVIPFPFVGMLPTYTGIVVGMYLRFRVKKLGVGKVVGATSALRKAA